MKDRFKYIKTGRLLIRTLVRDDAAAFYSYRSLPEVALYQSWWPSELREIEAFLIKNETVRPGQTGAWLQLAVCLEDGRLIGDIGLHFLENDQLEIGYTLSPVYQGFGYASEAVRAVLEYAFADLSIHRVTAWVDPDNGKSVKLLVRMGFRKEAHFIKSYFADDGWRDECVYAMLDEEWPNSCP